MSQLPFELACRCFDTVPDIRPLSVSQREFASLSSSIRSLQAELGDRATEDFWAPTMRFLKKYQFRLNAAPLQFNDSHAVQPLDIKQLQMLAQRRIAVYPGVGASIEDIVAKLQALLRIDNPLQDLAIDICKADGKKLRTALVLCDSKLVQPSEQVIRRFGLGRDVSIITASALQRPSFYDQIIVFGPPRWFPSSVFDSARSRKLYVLTFRWLVDRWTSVPALVGSTRPPTNQQFATGSSASNLGANPVSFSPEEVFMPLSAETLQEALALEMRTSSFANPHMSVDARFFALEGNEAIFLESVDSTGVLVIDLDGDPANIVKRLKVNDVSIGMFLVIRTGADGDYVRMMADALLGSDVERLRSSQASWKAALGKAVAQYGLPQSCRRLGELGARKASEANVRNWMWGRTIRPQYASDFKAIMDLIEMPERADAYWENARAILRAHIRAGMKIRRWLIDKVKSADLDRLQSVGRMNFELDHSSRETLCAARIVLVGPETVDVPVAKAGRVFSIESGIPEA